MMKIFRKNRGRILSREELKKINGRGGAGTPAPPIGTNEGSPLRSYKCCTDVSLSNCSQCVTLDLSAHCSGGNLLWNC